MRSASMVLAFFERGEFETFDYTPVRAGYPLLATPWLDACWAVPYHRPVL
jgi:hypothetical protein